MFKLISNVFGWILKIILFPFWFIWWLFTAPARKKRTQRDLERWACGLTNKELREVEEDLRDFDKYYR